MIEFKPDRFLRYFIPKSFFDDNNAVFKRVEKKFEVKKKELDALLETGLFTKKFLEESLKRVTKFYNKKSQRLEHEGERAFLKKAINNNRLIKHRLEDLALLENMAYIRKKYHGVKYRWLPSKAEEPCPQHQLLYGKIFIVDVTGDKDGNMPTERYGCRCGMQILTDEEADYITMRNEELKKYREERYNYK